MSLKDNEYLQRICELEAQVENLERRNRMLAIELDSRKLSKNFTPDEVADVLRCSAATVRNEMQRGKLHYYTIGTRYLIAPQHLSEYLKSIEF